MYYVYVLKNKKDSKRYIGLTANLNRRVEDHNSGKVLSTHNRRPFELIYFEQFKTKVLAVKRERFFKSGKGYDTLKYLLRLSR